MRSTESKSLMKCIKSIKIETLQRSSFFIIILLFYTCTGKYVKDHNFDHLILSQRWLPSACIEYIETSNGFSNSHFCTLPKDFKIWTIHGLWPTQNNTMGPFFCNKSMIFNISKIRPIEPELEMYWPNIEGGKTEDSLWEHEWEKHGTCAAQLESLNSELKYFISTMELYKKYNVQELYIKNIVPFKTVITASHLFDIIKNAFGKIPQIHCIQEVKTKESYLSEIRLCFNKNLELIDCGHIHSSGFYNNRTLLDDFKNCPTDGQIIIPDKINSTLGSKTVPKYSESWDYYNKLYNTLLFIRFLEWVSI